MTKHVETFQDQLLNFSIPARDARGRIARLDSVVAEVLSAHDYPSAIRHLLAEALLLGALMGGLQKEEGAQLTMQAQTQTGPVRLLVVDFKEGALRGYADFDRDALDEIGANPSLKRLFRNGYLAITFETGQGQRYQGIVPLEGASLAEACEHYFLQSEQIPTLVRLGVRFHKGQCMAGGMLLQHLPQGEVGRQRLSAQADHPDWEHVEVLGGSLSHAELIDSNLSMEALVWRLFHEEEKILIEKGVALKKGCRCTIEHYDEIVSRFPDEERNAMRNENGQIVVDCAFCSKDFVLNL